MTTKAQQWGSQRHEYAMQAPRGESRRLLCPSAPSWAGKGREKVFTCEEKSCTASPCIYASWKKRGTFSSSCQCGRARGAALQKREGGKKSPFVEPLIDVQEALFAAQVLRRGAKTPNSGAMHFPAGCFSPAKNSRRMQ